MWVCFSWRDKKQKVPKKNLDIHGLRTYATAKILFINSFKTISLKNKNKKVVIVILTILHVTDDVGNDILHDINVIWFSTIWVCVLYNCPILC